MSKVGKQPLKLEEGVSAKLHGGFLHFKGPKGELRIKALPLIEITIEGDVMKFEPRAHTKQAISNWGTLRSLAQGAAEGVAKGFERELEIEGVGYRAAIEGRNLVLNIGYSHPVKIEAPEGIVFSVEKNTIKISGIDKYLVGQTAANIRATKKPEPYKGKGIRYKGEVIRRKAGKKVAGSAA